MGGGRTWVRSALGRAAKSLVETIGTILNREGDEVAQLEDAVTAEAPELDRSLRPEAMQGHI
jgi:hypothetical protein